MVVFGERFFMISEDLACLVFKRKRFSVCLVLVVKHCRYFPAENFGFFCKVFRRYNEVLRDEISNVLLRKKF